MHRPSMVLSTGDSRFFEESVNAGRLRGLLAGRSHNAASGVQERTQAMKWLLAMVSKGRDVSQFFPDVVKNVVVRSVELKKLVYVYLMHYADHDATCRDLALLSINSFQKDLADGNPLIRALALRTMTSIRVRDIVQLQIMAVQKCAGDSSVHVRKAAAYALPKIFSLDKSTADELITLIVKLLDDHSNMVVGSAVAAFQEICPQRFDLIHPNFRRLCTMLPDMEEWSQVILISVLTKYSREFFFRPSVLLAPAVRAGTAVDGANAKGSQFSSHAYHGGGYASNGAPLISSAPSKARKLPTARELSTFYASDDDTEKEKPLKLGEETEEEQHQEVEKASAASGGANGADNSISASKETDEDVESVPVDRPLEPDHRHMLKTCMPLLLSRNSAVVLGAVTMMWYCGKRSDAAMGKIAAALVRLLNSPREVQYMALQAIVPIASDAPQFFRPYLESFFVKTASDASFVRIAKVDVLTLLAHEDNVDSILTEFEVYLSHPDKRFACSVIHAVGRLVNAMPNLADRCLRGLVSLMTSPDASVVGEAVVVTRTVLQQHPDHSTMVRRLVRMLDQTSIPSARASVVWIAAEFVHFVPDIAPEVLRKLALSFGTEAPAVKAQIVNLAVRLHMAFETPERFDIQKHLDEKTLAAAREAVGKLLEYILELARFDSSYDLRDRVRLLRSLLSKDNFKPLATQVLLAAKPPPNVQMIESTVVVDPQARFAFDSLSHCVGHSAPGYRALVDWPATRSTDNLREPKDTSRGYTSAASTSVAPRQFYNESSDDESGSSVASNGRSHRSGSVSSSRSSSSSGSSSSGSSSGSSRSRSGSESSSGSSSSSSSATEANRENGSAKHAEVDDVLAMFDSYAPGQKQATTKPMEPLAHEPASTASTLGTNWSQFANDAAAADNRPRYTVLSAVHGDGLRAEAVFTRAPSTYKQNMNEVLLYVTNSRSQAMTGIRITHLRLSDDQELIPFPEISTLPPGATEQVTIHADFGGKSKAPLKFSISNDRGAFPASLSAPGGELLVPAPELLEEEKFTKMQAQLSGMHEAKRTYSPAQAELLGNLTYEDLAARVYRAANVATACFAEGTLVAAGHKLARDKVSVLISLEAAQIRVGSDDFLLAATLCDDLLSQIF